MDRTSSSHEPRVEMITISGRRHWSTADKIRMVNASMEPGNSVSMVARANNVYPNLLYRWRSQMCDGGKTALESNSDVVSVAEYNALQKRVKQLERALGKQTLQVEILKEAVRIGREKKLISRQPLVGIEDFQ